MGTIFNLCGLLCIIAMLGHRSFDGDMLIGKLNNQSIEITNKQITNDQKLNDQTKQIINQQNLQKTKQLDPNQLLHIAKSQIGVREATGKNDGYEVEQYLACTGNKKGEAWCASFVSWVFGKAGYAAPRTAWSPSLFPKARLATVGKPAMIFGIYFADKKRIAHAGIVENIKHDWVTTIEGNTNIVGSRDGDGVYRKLRHTRTIAAYANLLPKEEGGAR